MQTYSTNKMLGRLAAHLLVYNKPFTFDGYMIEFTASDEFIQKMYASDPMLAAIDLKFTNPRPYYSSITLAHVHQRNHPDYFVCARRAQRCRNAGKVQTFRHPPVSKEDVLSQLLRFSLLGLFRLPNLIYDLQCFALEFICISLWRSKTTASLYVMFEFFDAFEDYDQFGFDKLQFIHDNQF